MTLYEMLDVTLYHQEVWIYEINVYGQNMPIFKGEVGEARCDVEKTWCYLMCQVDHYECNTGILVIKVKNEYYEKRLETQYSNSDKWGTKENERPWKHDIEIIMQLKSRTDTN